MLCSPALDMTIFVSQAHVSWVDELMRFLSVPGDSDPGLIPRITRQKSVSLSRQHFLKVLETFGLQAYF